MPRRRKSTSSIDNTFEVINLREPGESLLSADSPPSSDLHNVVPVRHWQSSLFDTKRRNAAENSNATKETLPEADNSQGYRWLLNTRNLDRSSRPLIIPNLVHFTRTVIRLLNVKDGVITNCIANRLPMIGNMPMPNRVKNFGSNIFSAAPHTEERIEQRRGENQEQIDLSYLFSSPAGSNNRPNEVVLVETEASRPHLHNDCPASVSFSTSEESIHFKPREAKKPAKMGSLHRSEVMKHCEMIVVKEAAYECIAEIGKQGMVQFVDLNAKKSTFARTFVKNMRRCEELERKLRYLEQQVIDCIPSIDPKPIDLEDVDTPTMADVVAIENRLDILERQFIDLNSNDHQLRKNLNSSKEYLKVVEKVEAFFQVHNESDIRKLERLPDDDAFQEFFNKSFSGAIPMTPINADMPLTPLLDPQADAWFVAGIIPLDKKLSFERVLWRASRRTAFVRTSDDYFTVDDPITLEPMAKCVFIILFKGESLRQIVDKVCDGFQARQYNCPKTSKERQMSSSEVQGRIHDLQLIIDSTQSHRYMILNDLSWELPKWLKSVTIQKATFHIMNMFTVDTNGFLAGECWVPDCEIENVRDALNSGFELSGTDVAPLLNELEMNSSSPTFHRTNKFTEVFQTIVNSYGVSAYREVNPAPYTVITFPFLFAVMFGDAAHGFILLLVALAFVFYEEKIIEKRIRNEIFNTFFGGRYIMLLMGCFSIYTGMIYNDAFAKSMNVFGSSWKNSIKNETLNFWEARELKKHTRISLELSPSVSYDREAGPYPFGVDPIWNIADNRLVFLNSMKMKASVLIGIAQMTFGVFLSLSNNIYFKSPIDVLTNFIPQLIFLSTIFIYLCVQIVVKWVFFSAKAGQVLGYVYPGPQCAPSLLIGLINMFMMKPRPDGYLDEEKNVLPSCYLNFWYPNQALVEQILLLTAIGCIPVMLIGKPLYVFLTGPKTSQRSRHRSGASKKGNGNAMEDIENLVKEASSQRASNDDHPHSMGDVIVHQAIHTIEFVIGCVSHTASYLRLWALSLAHAQLSEVLWHMVLMQGINITHNSILAPIVAYVSFGIFALLSLSILIMMEGLSAFLHALRLHWVEFQSKFYQGTGFAFQPFRLIESLEGAQLLSEEVTRKAEVARTKVKAI